MGQEGGASLAQPSSGKPLSLPLSPSPPLPWLPASSCPNQFVNVWGSDGYPSLPHTPTSGPTRLLLEFFPFGPSHHPEAALAPPRHHLDSDPLSRIPPCPPPPEVETRNDFPHPLPFAWYMPPRCGLTPVMSLTGSRARFHGKRTTGKKRWRGHEGPRARSRPGHRPPDRPNRRQCFPAHPLESRPVSLPGTALSPVPSNDNLWTGPTAKSPQPATIVHDPWTLTLTGHIQRPPCQQRTKGERHATVTVTNRDDSGRGRDRTDRTQSRTAWGRRLDIPVSH